MNNIFFLDDDTPNSADVLKVLEHIDDDTEELGVPLVKINDVSLAQHFGLYDELPILVYFEDRIPTIFEGTFFFNFIKIFVKMQ